MKLQPKKGNGGHITSYRLIIGSREARDAGFVQADGTTMELKKTVDQEHRRIIIELTDEGSTDKDKDN